MRTEHCVENASAKSTGEMNTRKALAGCSLICISTKGNVRKFM